MILSVRDLEKCDFHKILTSPLARQILGHDQSVEEHTDWIEFVTQQVRQEPPSSDLLTIGLAAFGAFLQSNITGPPLEWRSKEVVISDLFRNVPYGELQRQLVASLTKDGEAAYHLTPDVALFCLARCVILNFREERIKEAHLLQWSRIRINCWHQRMLGENVHSLQKIIYEDLGGLEKSVFVSGPDAYSPQTRAQFFLELAAIHTHYGFDARAREDIARAAKETGFEFALTGRMGKRTKFQQKELSQLVVLAKSADFDGVKQISFSDRVLNGHSDQDGPLPDASKPANLDLNDDTLLDSISFSEGSTSMPAIQDGESLPSSLASLDPANQPVLKPLDSIMLLALASSITNTSPQHGLTREETLPYATRVLESGSTNWQVYTQALLVRSRIEGYQSRTRERGVLQLQALVDQVVAETTVNSTKPSSDIDGADSNGSTTFLPRPKPSESAPVTERLQYIHQLAPPTRWTLETELAAKWVSLGGLRTALEIYERLEMWAEAALCWAAVEREDKARRIVRRQLYRVPIPEQDTQKTRTIPDEENPALEEYLGEERDQLPADAPRLFCILGDIEKDPKFYERAWLVSNRRYARAQRSLGKYYLSRRQFTLAEEAYSSSLSINPQNHSTWFALGCVRLETRNWQGAVDAFTRTVQQEPEDAEAWSNLAAALLRLPPNNSPSITVLVDTSTPSLQPNNHSAFTALKRAAALNRNSYRIWQNLLSVSATVFPPPYTDMIIAQTHLIELRGALVGEKCIDIEILDGLISHVTSFPASNTSSETASQSHSLRKMILTLIHDKITPLITTSRPLYLLLAKLELHLGHPAKALELHEKAWRAVINKPGWENGNEEEWREVVQATVELVGAYEGLGEPGREHTKGEMEDGRGRVAGRDEGKIGEENTKENTKELVCKDWRFKARSAINGVLGRAKDAWSDDGGYQRLKKRMSASRAVK